MCDDGLQCAAIHALPTTFQRNKLGRFAARCQQRKPFLDLKTNPDGNAHALLRQKAAAAPPAQRRIVAHACPVKNAKAIIFKFNKAVFLRLVARCELAFKTRKMRCEWIFVNGPHDPHRSGVEAKIAAHNADPVIAMTREIAKRTVDAPK